MDPLSISTSILAILGAIRASVKIVTLFRVAPAEIQALVNAIASLTALVNDVEAILSTGDSSMDTSGLESLTESLLRAMETVESLNSFVHSCLFRGAESGKNVPFRPGSLKASTRGWLRARERALQLKNEVSLRREELGKGLQLAVLAINRRAELNVTKITSLGADAIKILNEHKRQISDLKNDVQDIQESLITVSTAASMVKAPTLAEALEDVEVQKLWHPPFLCAMSCHCCCHWVHRGRSPLFVTSILGAFFWSYSGLGFVGRNCDVSTCRQSITFNLRISYYFPLWWVRKAVNLTCSIPPLGGPQVSLKTARIVDGGAPIFHLTEQADVEGIKELFRNHQASPFDTDCLRGRTPFMSAVIRGHTGVIDLFIFVGADKYAQDYSFRSPASIAWDIIFANLRQPEHIAYLQTRFSDSNCVETYCFSPIHEVIIGLRCGDVNEVLASNPDWIDSVDTRGNTPLIWAARRGDSMILRRLLGLGANIKAQNAAGEDPLIEAIRHTRYECCEILLSAGAPIQTDRQGRTGFHVACDTPGNITAVQILLKRGIDVNARDVLNRTPLGLASFRNHSSIVRLLLEHSADIEARDGFGSTPLARAVHYKACGSAMILLEHGANPAVIDKNGRTLLHRAALTNDIAIFDLLASYSIECIDPMAEDISGQTARQCLLDQKPGLETLVAFTKLVDSIKAGTDTETGDTSQSLSRTSSEESFYDALEH